MDEAEAVMKKMAKRVFDKSYETAKEISVNAVRPVNLDREFGLATSFIPTATGLIITQASSDNNGKVVQVAMTQELIDIFDEVVCRFNPMWRKEEETTEVTSDEVIVEEEIEVPDEEDLAKLLLD